MFPGLRHFSSSAYVQYNTRKWKSSSSVSVYYTAYIPKNKNRGGLGTRLVNWKDYRTVEWIVKVHVVCRPLCIYYSMCAADERPQLETSPHNTQQHPAFPVSDIDAASLNTYCYVVQHLKHYIILFTLAVYMFQTVS